MPPLLWAVGPPAGGRVSDVIAPSTVSGAFGMSIACTLGLVLVLISVAALGRSSALSQSPTLGGPVMPIRIRNRLALGFICIAAATVVAVIGYLGLSRNPDVNRQIPYLASAGMAVVILAAVGGAFIVAEQLRNDDQRLMDLEEAVRLLADAVAPAIEAPARTTRAPVRRGSAQPAPPALDPPPPRRRPARRPPDGAQRRSPAGAGDTASG
jgi:hypothetical protein